MNYARRWLATFPTRHERYTSLDLVAWLLCAWSVVYVGLLSYFSAAGRAFQDFVQYGPLVVMFGTSVILLVAISQAHPEHRLHYRFACLALLITQVLDVIAVLPAIPAFVFGNTAQLSGGFWIYVLIYVSLIYSIGLFVPFWAFPRIPLLRITIDAALVMAVTDVLLRLLLPLIIPGWRWNMPLLACTFRLESTLGLFFWYTRLFFRFGDASVVPIRLWLLGFSCLLVNDALVLWTTFLAPADDNVIRSAVPFWMLNQSLWALALYRSRRTPSLWRSRASDVAPDVFYPPLWQQVVRLVVTLSTLVVVVATGPTLPSGLWFFCALLSRELLTLFERARVVDAEREAREKLAVTNRELAMANDELRRTEEELSQANQRLRQLSDLQAEQIEQRQIRVAEVAHDMGNLLQPARVSLAVMKEALGSLPSADTTRLRESLEMMEENVLMSENLLRTIVGAARLDAGILVLSLGSIKIDMLLKRVVRYQQSRDIGPPVLIQLDLPASLPPVRGDEDLLTRAVWNLVGNAVKYTGAARRNGSGQVMVAAYAHNGLVHIIVRDNGPGIASDVLERLGRPFVRGVDEPSAPAGFGLGLAFSRGVIEQHPSGELTLASVVGEGTEVRITLAVEEPIELPHERALGSSSNAQEGQP